MKPREILLTLKDSQGKAVAEFCVDVYDDRVRIAGGRTSVHLIVAREVAEIDLQMKVMLNEEVKLAVLEEIQRAGKKSITNQALCWKLFPGEGPGPWGHNSRRVDRALQKLRKEGKIHYYSPVIGWRPGKS